MLAIYPRRAFLKYLASSALLASTGAFAPLTLAQNRFDFRLNKTELLLHFNENSLGMSPKALAAAQQAIVKHGNRYPDDLVGQLRNKLADKLNIPAPQLIFGNGSTEVIGAVVALAAEKQATVIEPSPTFGDVKHRASAYGLTVKSVPVNGDFITDITALRKAANNTSGEVLINICNPNNPTGTIVNDKLLRTWINEAPNNHMFLIDEAYFEYAIANPLYSSVLDLIQAGKENLIVTRTFSKIYGMAGMRIGYGFTAPETAKAVDKYATSYNLSAAGVAAAISSLEDIEFYNKSMASNAHAKKILTQALDTLELEYIKSDTNFLLHRINSDVENYGKRMKQNGIRVGRRMTKQDGWNRVSIGQPAEMDDFVKTLMRFRELGWV